MENNVDMNQMSAMFKKTVLTSPNIVCECGCKTFIAAAALKKVSSVVSMTGRDEIIDIPVYVCSSCGKIPKEYTDNANFKKIFGEDVAEEEKKETILKV